MFVSLVRNQLGGWLVTIQMIDQDIRERKRDERDWKGLC